MIKLLIKYRTQILVSVFVVVIAFMMVFAHNLKKQQVPCEGKLHTLVHVSGQELTMWGCDLRLHENNYHQLRWYLDGNSTIYDTNWALKSN